MDSAYFKNIQRHLEVSSSDEISCIVPTRHVLIRRQIKGREIGVEHTNAIPHDTLQKMVSGATNKYTKMTEKIICQIQTTKRKGTVKYQTLGWRQAKEIKLWCNQNNINCTLVEDSHISRNKLISIDIWHNDDGTLYSDGTEDYGREYLDFRKSKQNVVYVKIEM